MSGRKKYQKNFVAASEWRDTGRAKAWPEINGAA